MCQFANLMPASACCSGVENIFGFCDDAASDCLLNAAGSSSGTTGTTGFGGTTAGGGTSGTSSCTPDTWASYGQNFMNTYCLPCHDPGGSFPDCSTQSSVQLNASADATSISTTSMPKGASLSQAEIDRVTTWLNCGAP
jgi:hypothetical protein